MSQENPKESLSHIYNAGKLFEPKPVSEKTSVFEQVLNPTDAPREKRSVIGAFMPKREDPIKEKVEAILRGIEEAEPASAKATAAKEEKAVDTENLESNGSVTVGPLEGEFDPKEFFRNDNKGVELNVWDNFKNNIAGTSRNISEQPPANISSYTLKKALSDSEICAELPLNHVFTQDDLWMIADLLKKQPNGGSGELSTDKRNLFYVQVGALVLVVGVGWYGSVWNVGVWGFDEGGQWNGGRRVFSCNG